MQQPINNSDFAWLIFADYMDDNNIPFGDDLRISLIDPAYFAWLYEPGGGGGGSVGSSVGVGGVGGGYDVGSVVGHYFGGGGYVGSDTGGVGGSVGGGIVGIVGGSVGGGGVGGGGDDDSN